MCCNAKSTLFQFCGAILVHRIGQISREMSRQLLAPLRRGPLRVVFGLNLPITIALHILISATFDANMSNFWLRVIPPGLFLNSFIGMRDNIPLTLANHTAQKAMFSIIISALAK